MLIFFVCFLHGAAEKRKLAIAEKYNDIIVMLYSAKLQINPQMVLALAVTWEKKKKYQVDS